MPLQLHTCLILFSMASPVVDHAFSLLRTTCLRFRYPCARNIFTTSVLNSRIIRKRITRIPADHHVYQHEVDDGSLCPNDLPQLKLVNRNPRNLEQLCLEPKLIGWELETQTRNFWNRWVDWMQLHYTHQRFRVTFEKNGKYLTAQVIHHSGRVIMTASSKDPAFKAQTTGSGLTDINAARNLATIIARKCFEAGILYLHKDLSEERTSQKVWFSTFIVLDISFAGPSIFSDIEGTRNANERTWYDIPKKIERPLKFRA